ncbi:aminopeptidase P family protein [Acetobacter sacchari]|uniref:Aminopeptidase P family protein n=1 Tax=Acetobacter sacchari TaxID=2661687 RepID=A0ABS3M0F4_9PROT|nr:aminopeptidase P family protein [Acetobacter sacchari]MBO1361657.1 aminopeptidase P family protein [Acetobacter sacchari]
MPDASPARTTELARRLTALRAIIAEEGLDGLIVPRSDEYLGEYVPASAERLAWISGFTGSAGVAAILKEHAAVFSDGRYITQMDDEVDASVWEKQHITETPPRDWLSSQTQSGELARIGYDPRVMSRAARDALQSSCIELVPTSRNLIDAIWSDRPAEPLSPAIIQPLEFSGVSSTEKRAELAEALAASGHDVTVISDTTSIAWLLNIRGTDVPSTPVTLSTALLHRDGRVDLFIDERKFSPEIRQWLGNEVGIRAPKELTEALSALSGKTVALDPAGTPVWFEQTLTAAGAKTVDVPDPCALPRARKNRVEQEGARTAHVRDAVAVCRFLHWLESSAVGSTELDAAARLQAFRAEAPEYRDDSFTAISGVGPNGAIMHYRVTPESSRPIGADMVYLIDSGGQYPDGTTDITRTVWTGPNEPPAEIKSCFTRVLKGNLLLARAVFPVGTTGHALDSLARYALWQARLDFDHGTGHGVGSYLSVHEGPQRIAKAPNAIALAPGMIVSNEPGYYRPGAFGIRLETLLLVCEPEIGPDGKAFLSFETLTLAPFDQRLIDIDVLGEEDARILDAYHAHVLASVGPLLPSDERSWLAHACSPIKRK